MSKVVHLSDDAHATAKKHCQKAGMKMSEWVAALIGQATQPTPATTVHVPPSPPPDVRELGHAAATPRQTHAGAVPRKHALPHEAAVSDDAGVTLYTAPPFWARSQSAPGSAQVGK